MDDRDFVFRQKGRLVFVSGCRPTLGPTQPNIQSLLRVPATGGRHLEREFDNSALCIAEVYKSEMGSSVSIVFGYGMDDQEIEVRSPAEAMDFSSSLCV
jgi:hypothetical protein